MKRLILNSVPNFARYGLAGSLEDVLDMPFWLFWEYLKAIKRDRVLSSVEMAQAIGVALGAGETIAKNWEATLKEGEPEPPPPARTEKSKAETLQQLSALFAEFG